MTSTASAAARLNVPAHVKHERLIAWVTEMAALTGARDVVWCDGSDEEYDRLCKQLVDAGTFTRLNPELRPHSFLARSSPSDVARRRTSPGNSRRPRSGYASSRYSTIAFDS